MGRLRETAVRPQHMGGFMKVLMRIVAVVLVAIGAFLIYAVIHAMASAGGAKVGVSIAYVVGAIVLAILAGRLWRRKTAVS
jgi:multisubunit Na+/H+ antiporter MnhB subunit